MAKKAAEEIEFIEVFPLKPRAKDTRKGMRLKGRKGIFSALIDRLKGRRKAEIEVKLPEQEKPAAVQGTAGFPKAISKPGVLKKALKSKVEIAVRERGWKGHEVEHAKIALKGWQKRKRIEFERLAAKENAVGLNEIERKKKKMLEMDLGIEGMKEKTKIERIEVGRVGRKTEKEIAGLAAKALKAAEKKGYATKEKMAKPLLEKTPVQPRIEIRVAPERVVERIVPAERQKALPWKKIPEKIEVKEAKIGKMTVEREEIPEKRIIERAAPVKAAEMPALEKKEIPAEKPLAPKSEIARVIEEKTGLEIDSATMQRLERKMDELKSTHNLTEGEILRELRKRGEIDAGKLIESMGSLAGLIAAGKKKASELEEKSRGFEERMREIESKRFGAPAPEKSRIERAIEEKATGTVNEQKLKELEERVMQLVKAYKIPEAEIMHGISGVEPHKILEDFDKLINLIELERKAKAVEPVSEEILFPETHVGFGRKVEEIKGMAKEIEKHKIVTDLDKILRVVREKGIAGSSILEKEILGNSKKVRQYAEILQNDGLVKIDYPPIGEIRVMDANYEKDKKKKGNKQ